MNEQTPQKSQFRSNKVLSRLITILTGLFIVSVLVVLLTYFNFLVRLSSYLNNPPTNFIENSMAYSAVYEAAYAFDDTYAFFTTLYVPLVLVVQVLLLFWVYFSARNLPAMGIRGMKYPPGMAVGWFLIPAANLVMPPLVFTEIWKASSPNPKHGEWRQSPTTPLIALWWLCLLGMLIASFLLPLFLKNAPDPATSGDTSATTTQLVIIGLLQIGWAAGLNRLVAGITSKQNIKNELHLSVESTGSPYLAREEPAIDGTTSRDQEQEATLAELPVLTQEEKMVLSLLVKPSYDDEIAKILHVPAGHILQVKTSLFHKFGVNRDDDLVWEARKRGYL